MRLLTVAQVFILISLEAPFCFGQTSKDRFGDWWKIESDWHSIAESKALSSKERAALTDAVAALLRSSMADIGIESEEDLRKAAAQTRVKAVDLTGKGSREFLAQGTGKFLCTPTGNCAAWVLRQHGDRYSVILDRGSVQQFTILPSITNGFHDLVLHQHGSAYDQGLYLFHFNGSAYRLAACYGAWWQVLEKDGSLRDLDEPQITPCPKKGPSTSRQH